MEGYLASFRCLASNHERLECLDKAYSCALLVWSLKCGCSMRKSLVIAFSLTLSNFRFKVMTLWRLEELKVNIFSHRTIQIISKYKNIVLLMSKMNANDPK